MINPDDLIGRTFNVRLIPRGRCSTPKLKHTGLHGLNDDCTAFMRDGSYEVDRTFTASEARQLGDEGRLYFPDAIEVDGDLEETC